MVFSVGRCNRSKTNCFTKAGVVIAQEAGGFVSGSSETPLTGIVDEKILTGRKYIVIRYGYPSLRSYPVLTEV